MKKERRMTSMKENRLRLTKRSLSVSCKSLYFFTEWSALSVRESDRPVKTEFRSFI